MASKDESKSTPKESVQTSKSEASAEHKPKQKNKRKRKKSQQSPEGVYSGHSEKRATIHQPVKSTAAATSSQVSNIMNTMSSPIQSNSQQNESYSNKQNGSIPKPKFHTPKQAKGHSEHSSNAGMQNTGMSQVLHEAIMNRLDSIDSRLRSLDSIDKQLLCTNGKISVLESRLGDNENTIKSIHKTVSDLEECKNYDSVKLSELCDDQKRLDHTQSQIQNELRKTRELNTKLQEELIELKGRSMRDNLLFFNFPEQTYNQRNEACIDKIFDFCELELGIDNVRQNVKIDRAHRIGQPRPNRIRPIVAKFNYFQDKETIKKAATEKLKNSRYSVGDQYPVEIQQRRRKLIPVLKKAQSEGKCAVLVYDKLYINGSRYVEQSQESNMVGHQRYNERQTHGNEFGYYPRERRVQDNALGEQNKKQYTRAQGHSYPSLFRHSNKSVPPLSNRFAPLETMEDFGDVGVMSVSARSSNGQTTNTLNGPALLRNKEGHGDVDATSASARLSKGQNTNTSNSFTLLENSEDHVDVDAASGSAWSSSGLNANGPKSYGSAIGAVVESMLMDSNMDSSANDMSTHDSVLGAVGGATPLVALQIDNLYDGATSNQRISAGMSDQSA